MELVLNKLVDFFADADNKLIDEFNQKSMMQSFKKGTHICM